MLKFSNLCVSSDIIISHMPRHFVPRSHPLQVYRLDFQSQPSKHPNTRALLLERWELKILHKCRGGASQGEIIRRQPLDASQIQWLFRVRVGLFSPRFKLNWKRICRLTMQCKLFQVHRLFIPIKTMNSQFKQKHSIY